MSDAKEAVERRSDEAFAASAWQDPRADYRAMLRQLRERNTPAFEEAVRAYETGVVARLGDGSADPVAAWLGYGRRLASIAGGGRTVRIDEDGRAQGLGDDDAPAEPALLLQLPADESAPAFVVAAPREPSAAQRATVALLVAGAQLLPT